MVQLRRLAEVNPSTPVFDKTPAAAEVTFQPLDTVWADDRADRTRVSIKADVATGYVRFQDGDVLLPKTAPTFQHARTMLVRCAPNGAGAGSSELHVLRAKTGVDPRFIAYVVRSDTFIREGISAYQGVAGLQRVSADFVAEWPISSPGLDEQRRIADFLDDQVALLDHAARLRKLQVPTLVERTRECIRVAVAGGSSSVGPPEAPWVARLHRDALLQPMARTLTLQRGVDLTNDERRDGSFLVYTTAGANGLHDKFIVSGPGVVIGRYGSIGSVFWADKAHWPHNTTLYVRDYKGNQPRYIYFLLRSYPYNRLQTRSAIPGINRNDMARDLMPWLPVRLQDSAVAACERAEQMEARGRHVLERSIALLQERKQTLITAAVTGQFDVTTARSGLSVDVR